MTIPDIHNMVHVDCSASAWGEPFYYEHILPVQRIACIVAPTLGADPLVIEAASILHDLAAIRNTVSKIDHCQEGAVLAREILAHSALSYTQIELVASCVLLHSHPQAPGTASPEAVCISHADVLSKIDRALYWISFLFNTKNMSVEQATRWISKEKIDKWDVLDPHIRSPWTEKYTALTVLLKTDV